MCHKSDFKSGQQDTRVRKITSRSTSNSYYFAPRAISLDVCIIVNPSWSIAFVLLGYSFLWWCAHNLSNSSGCYFGRDGGREGGGAGPSWNISSSQHKFINGQIKPFSGGPLGGTFSVGSSSFSAQPKAYCAIVLSFFSVTLLWSELTVCLILKTIKAIKTLYIKSASNWTDMGSLSIWSTYVSYLPLIWMSPLQSLSDNQQSIITAHLNGLINC